VEDHQSDGGTAIRVALSDAVDQARRRRHARWALSALLAGLVLAAVLMLAVLL
jgi:hypothetical protein